MPVSQKRSIILKEPIKIDKHFPTKCISLMSTISISTNDGHSKKE